MRVLSAEPLVGEMVHFDTEPHECIRYSADNWVVNTGMDTYTLTDCAKVEAAYQAFKSLNR